jgi:diaminopimelate epimerase
MAVLPLSLQFTKVEGLANDFVVVESSLSSPDAVLSKDARIALCDRRRGVGADGVLLVLPPVTAGAIATMHVTNSDGSEPEMCGNGLRCVARVLTDAGRAATTTPFVVDTGAGRRQVTVHDDGTVEIDMGDATFVDEKAGVPRLDTDVLVDGVPARAMAVSMGNPHLVIERRGDRDVVTREGPRLETDPRFPHRVNVGFATKTGERALDLVVWERGAGLTEACGTGACAAVAAFTERGLLPRGVPVAVRLPGGVLLVTVDENRRVQMRGPARVVFHGNLPVTPLV